MQRSIHQSIIFLYTALIETQGQDSWVSDQHLGLVDLQPREEASGEGLWWFSLQTRSFLGESLLLRGRSLGGVLLGLVLVLLLSGLPAGETNPRSVFVSTEPD
jgi:hypothetical protein